MTARDGRGSGRQRHGSTVVRALIAALGIATALVALDRRASARAPNASVGALNSLLASADAPDSATLARVLASARGANALICELASATVDGRNGWGGGWIGMGGVGAEGELARQLANWPAEGREDLPSVRLLRAGIADADACVRRLSAPLLGRMRTAAAIDALLGGLREASTETREMAALGLGFAESRRPIEPLSAALRDASPRVRATSAWALGEIEDRSAIPALVAVLKDADRDVRRTAARALGEIEDPAAIGALADLLRQDADPEVRRAAAWALGEIEG